MPRRKKEVEKKIETPVAEKKEMQYKSGKQEAAEYMQKEGYDAEVVNGVVMVYFNPGECDGFHEKVSEMLKNHGYKASFGTKVKSKHAIREIQEDV